MNALLIQSVLLADWWTNLMSDLDPNKRFALITVVFGCVTGVICTIVVFVSGTINSIHRRRVEADMKREMIERGMSADEIATIIEAASPPETGTQRWIASCGKSKKA